MLPITESQARILEKFIEFDGDMEGKVGRGLSSARLERLGISRQTFDKKDKEREKHRVKKIKTNRDFLVDNYFLRITQQEEHGNQIWEYFLITTLGVLAYLRWKAMENQTSGATITKAFFPLIIDHFKEIQTLYGHASDLILFETAKKIVVEPHGFLRSPDGKRTFYDKKLVMKITLPMGSIEVILHRDLGEPKFNINKIESVKYFDDSPNNELNQNISDWYTFTFYYNLIILHRDSPLLIKTIWYVDPFVMDKDGQTHFQDMSIYEQKIKKFGKKMSSNALSVVNIINQDLKLNSMFKKTFLEIESKLKDREIIKFLKENLK